MYECNKGRQQSTVLEIDTPYRVSDPDGVQCKRIAVIKPSFFSIDFSNVKVKIANVEVKIANRVLLKFFLDRLVTDLRQPADPMSPETAM